MDDDDADDERVCAIMEAARRTGDGGVVVARRGSRQATRTCPLHGTSSCAGIASRLTRG